MAIYKLTIPVDDYYREAVYFQGFYFDSDHSPSKEEVMLFLQENSVHAEQNPEEYMGTNVFAECIESINSITSPEKWPSLYMGLIQTNVRTNHSKWGDQPITMRLIDPIKL